MESQPTAPDATRLRSALLEQIPAANVLTDAEALRPFECDAFTAHRRLPLAVVIPDTVEQVCHVMRTCNEQAVPVVARGAGTGLSGGSMPHEHGVLLVLAKFNRVLEVNPANRTARVQPGVRNLAISELVSAQGLYFAPDPSSQLACSIGGNVAENAGGVHCLKYGLTVHNVQALTLVTIDGELLHIGSAALDAAGYDLMALLTGSEGMLGVIVEITVKLLPTPELAQVVLAAFATIEDAGRAVAAIVAEGVIPAGLEMVDQAGIRAIEELLHAGYPVDAAAILLCEVDGTAAEVSEQLDQVQAILQREGVTEMKVSQNEQQRQTLWTARKAAFPALARLAPDNYVLDGTIPRKSLATVLKQIEQLAKNRGLQVINVFHAGDGNMHPAILFDGSIPGEQAKAESLGAEIMRLCVDAGGTITGEHGVGIEKVDQMCAQFASGELAQFHALKQAFDPHTLLNPGKAVPSLNRCAEMGAMHVHRGQLPFPELERF